MYYWKLQNKLYLVTTLLYSQIVPYNINFSESICLFSVFVDKHLIYYTTQNILNSGITRYTPVPY